MIRTAEGELLVLLLLLFPRSMTDNLFFEENGVYEDIYDCYYPCVARSSMQSVS